MPSFLVALISLFSFVLAGCAPLPYVRTSKPEMTGILLQNGMPVPDVLIISCARGQLPRKCERIKKTLTDGQGRFFFEAEWEFDKLVPYIGDTKFSYGISFHYLGRDFHWNGSGVGDTPKSVDLRCEVRNTVLCTTEITEP
ncbi:hypothetical protein MGMO_88c00400 [Methyloglobulus morosus KoM1]|uniref:Uncharacterized protein n=1 Tax=Methyloglobulus morosus KoM1 TaxID=1116472 RepID=V5C515_9GAMM|nr:hypothetical protein [Methyloglobulus morosus]ESS71828.1 hypothetical protein MGMO_88c00400 [Methyloglobulus morosus KoM1]